MRRLIVSIIFLICICMTFMLFTACAVPDKKGMDESGVVVSQETDDLNNVLDKTVSSNGEKQEKANEKEITSVSGILNGENNQTNVSNEDNSEVQNNDGIIKNDVDQRIIYLPEVP